MTNQYHLLEPISRSNGRRVQDTKRRILLFASCSSSCFLSYFEFFFRDFNFLFINKKNSKGDELVKLKAESQLFIEKRKRKKKRKIMRQRKVENNLLIYLPHLPASTPCTTCNAPLSPTTT